MISKKSVRNDLRYIFFFFLALNDLTRSLKIGLAKVTFSIFLEFSIPFKDPAEEFVNNTTDLRIIAWARLHFGQRKFIKSMKNKYNNKYN